MTQIYFIYVSGGLDAAYSVVEAQKIIVYATYTNSSI